MCRLHYDSTLVLTLPLPHRQVSLLHPLLLTTVPASVGHTIHYSTVQGGRHFLSRADIWYSRLCRQTVCCSYTVEEDSGTSQLEEVGQAAVYCSTDCRLTATTCVLWALSSQGGLRRVWLTDGMSGHARVDGSRRGSSSSAAGTVCGSCL